MPPWHLPLSVVMDTHSPSLSQLNLSEVWFDLFYHSHLSNVKFSAAPDLNCCDLLYKKCRPRLVRGLSFTSAFFGSHLLLHKRTQTHTVIHVRGRTWLKFTHLFAAESTIQTASARDFLPLWKLWWFPSDHTKFATGGQVWLRIQQPEALTNIGLSH